MPAYQYSALDLRGRTRKGTLEGDTARQIRQQLRERELAPLEVQELSGGQAPGHAQTSSTHQTRWQRSRLSATELALLTRQLATLVQAGLPLEQALGAVAEHSTQTRAQQLLLAVRARVLEGHSLATGLADFPRAFPDLFRATVAAGEQSGHLAVVLERLADYTESRQQLRQKAGLALIYPLLLTGVAIIIVIGLLIYVVPQVVQVFVSMQQQLPLLTRLLIALSDFLQAYGYILLGTLIAVGLAFGYAMRSKRVRRYGQKWLLHLPLLGKLLRSLGSARFARTLSILLASGVPVLEGLRISAQVIGNLPMREAAEHATTRVKEGGSLHRALAASGYFPPLTVQLIASGEASGQLEHLLDQAARQQEREAETLIAALLSIFEPVLILLMGGIVLLIVLAILLPIFDLNQLVR